MILSGKLILAPMAGFTDLSFRTVCGSMGADVTCCEMVSAKGLYYSDKKTATLLRLGEDEVPCGYQIFGRDPDIMAWAAEKLDGCGNAYLDVNLGCPVPKVVKNGEGSALLREPELIYSIFRRMREATGKPLTGKIRAGIQGAPEDAAVQAAQAIESAGGSAVTVHGRTREQYYSGSCDLETIRRVKESVGIPVIGNGDIAGFDDAERMRKETGVDGVMVGRAALGNPWVFREIKARAAGGPLPERPSTEEIKDVMLRHFDSMVREKGEYSAVREMRKFVPKYLKGLPGSAEIRRAANSISSRDEFRRTIDSLGCQIV